MTFYTHLYHFLGNNSEMLCYSPLPGDKQRDSFINLITNFAYKPGISSCIHHFHSSNAKIISKLSSLLHTQNNEILNKQKLCVENASKTFLPFLRYMGGGGAKQKGKSYCYRQFQNRKQLKNETG